MTNPLKRAIDTGLGGLRTTRRERATLFQYAVEEKRMKKKLPAGLVLALILLLVAMTALAVTALSGYFNGFASLENDHGAYSGAWPASAKTALVRLLRDSGRDIDTEKAKELLDASPDAAQEETLAAQILDGYFGGMEIVNTYTVMLRELGAFESWPQEQKALYSSLLVQYGHQKEDWPLYLMPEKGDVQEGEAIRKARELILETFSWPQEQVEAFPAVTAFFQAAEYGEAPVWMIEVISPLGRYFITLSRSGELMELLPPGQTALGQGGLEGVLAEAKAAVPGARDATAEAAIANAKNGLSEIIGLMPEEMQALDAQAYFLYHERFCNGWEPVWLVIFSRDGAPAYKALMGYDASHIDIVAADREFSLVQRRAPELSTLEDELAAMALEEMTLEEQAAFSQKWIPAVQAYEEANPYYHGEGRSAVWEMTRRVFGVPTAQDISQEEALSAALGAAKELGATDALLDRLIDHGFVFDITEPDKPQWRIILRRKITAEPVQDGDYTVYNTVYCIKLDARTGAVLDGYQGSPQDIRTFLSKP